MDIVLNVILFACLVPLGFAIVVLMNRRDRLKAYGVQSDEAKREIDLDKFIALLAGVVCWTVVLIVFLGLELGWFFVLELLFVLVADLALFHRLRYQRQVLAECIISYGKKGR